MVTWRLDFGFEMKNDPQDPSRRRECKGYARTRDCQERTRSEPVTNRLVNMRSADRDGRRVDRSKDCSRTFRSLLRAVCYSIYSYVWKPKVRHIQRNSRSNIFNCSKRRGHNQQLQQAQVKKRHSENVTCYGSAIGYTGTLMGSITICMARQSKEMLANSSCLVYISSDSV